MDALIFSDIWCFAGMAMEVEKDTDHAQMDA